MSLDSTQTASTTTKLRAASSRATRCGLRRRLMPGTPAEMWTLPQQLAISLLFSLGSARAQMTYLPSFRPAGIAWEKGPMLQQQPCQPSSAESKHPAQQTHVSRVTSKSDLNTCETQGLKGACQSTHHQPPKFSPTALVSCLLFWSRHIECSNSLAI